MIDTIIFDFGNVLYWFDYDRFLEAIKPHTSRNIQHVWQQISEGEHSPRIRYEKGLLSTNDFLETLQQEFALDLPTDRIGDLYNGIFEPNGEMLTLLPELSKEFKVALLSNTCEIHFERTIRKMQGFSLFSAVVLSHEEGEMKPAAQIFESATRRLDRPPASCLFVDDLEQNVESARTLGFEGFRYDAGEGNTSTSHLLQFLQKHSSSVNERDK